MGAGIVEKHLALERGGQGLDDPIAVNPAEFAAMVESVRKAEGMEPTEVLRWLEEEHGEERLEGVLGTGRKELTPGERPYYTRTNRSIHAIGRIEVGEALTPKNITLLRTESNLNPGLAPRYLELILGKPAKRTIEDGAGVTWNDVL
jgi:N-acetylneuraminate synthase